jgi:putative transposase
MTETLVGVSPPESEEPPVRPATEELEAARELVRQARAQGLGLTGPNGLLKALTKTVIETALDEEMSEHLGYDKHAPEGRNRGNSRNGKRTKTVLTDACGEVDIEVPRDRDGSFDPVVVRKRQRRLSEVDEVVLSLYAKGLTTGEISAHFAEVYGASVSKDTVTRITDRVIEEMQAWWSRPLEGVYAAVFIDAIMVKIRDGQVGNRPIYAAIGVDLDGHKDLLGMWAGDGDGESAKFWMAVLTELRNRGVKDVFFVVCDGLKGLPDSVNAVFPLATVLTSSIDTGRWRDGPAGHRATGERTYADVCLRGPHADLSLPVEAGRVVASGSRASSAVMRFQHGRPVGDVSGKGVASAGFISGRVDRGERSVRRDRLG